MTDYALARLSHRSFEHLVQALAVKIIGPGIVVFGDGPDGGREATFERKVAFPSALDPWDGYGVVQAKFLQRPYGAPKDGDWALDQLKDELSKYLDPSKNLRQPDYFVFATNAVLTPANGRGSKDRALALLDEFKANSSLRDYAIWDYDQICRFLDADGDVRTAHEPFITPGDVLAAIMGQSHPDLGAMEETLVNFLQKELLSDEFVNLEQAGHELDEGIPLARVFVDLPTVDEPTVAHLLPGVQLDAFVNNEHEDLTDNGFIKQILVAASERLNPAASGGTEVARTLDPGVTQDARGRFVLIGGPGQGKTTLGQFICQIFRASIISQRPEQTLSREVRRALSIIQDQCESEDIDDEVVPRFPFRLSLNDFASTLSNSPETGVSSVFSYLARQITRRTDKNITGDDLRLFLSHYPSIIIFDGLDEVPASSNRNQILDAIRDFWVDAGSSNADILSIATSRPQGYNEDFSPRYYRHCHLAELSRQLGLHFARRLVDARYGTDTDRKDKVLERLERAFESESTSRLMRSPLQLTIMTALVDRMGQPPQERWNLFKSYYDVIYQREEERNIPASDILRRYSPDINAIHHQVGLLLQIYSEQTGTTDAKLSRQKFISLVEARLKEEGHEGNRLLELAQQIVEAAAERLVFLVEVEEEQVGFEIRSLQEFMAAQSLMEGTDNDVKRRLEEIAPIQFWRNVFLFAAGKCFNERQDLRDTVISICAGLNELDFDEISAASLAGSDLAVALLDEGLTLSQPKYAQMIARVAARCLDSANPSLQVRFARVYEPQSERIYQDEISRRINSGRGIGFVGAWNCLLRLVLDDIPWAVQLANDNWPKDFEAQLEILGANLDPMNNPWTVKKVTDLLRIAPMESLRSKLGFGPAYRRYDTRALEPVEEAAFETLQPYFRHTNNGVRILDSAVAYADLVRINGREAEYIKRLQNTENWHPSWLVYRYAGRFLEGPSEVALASALQSLAESFVPNWGEQSENRILRLPWPISACLTVCKSSSELLEMAEKARSGELGDVGDWLAAEIRWSEDGITKEDLMSMTADRSPFDAAIRDVGFPTALRFLPVMIEPSKSYERLEELLDIFHAVPDGDTNAFVANAINWSLFYASLPFYRDHRFDPAAIDLGTLRSIYQKVPTGSPVPANMLLRTLDARGHDLLDFVEEAQKLSFQFTFDGNRETGTREIADLLHESYIKHSRNPALLPILAEAAQQRVLARILIDVQKPEEYATAENKSAALLINLAQESWETDCADEWISITEEVAVSNSDVYDRIIATFQGREAVGFYFGKYLNALGRLIPSERFQTHAAYIDLLENVLAKRTSKFDDLASASEFNFPRGIVQPIDR